MGAHSSEDRSTQVRTALLKALAAVVVIGVAVALGTTLVVRALGLNASDSPGPVGAAPAGPIKPLPTKALRVRGGSATAEPSDSPTSEPSKKAKPRKRNKNSIELQISPVTARPMERVNLTGSYQSADNRSLQVQRFQDGAWSDFGVTATVRVGTFATYVQTGRVGEQRFRMHDPQADRGSNVVMVTIRR